MQINARLELPSFDYDAYVLALQRIALETISRASLEYITTALSIIPVYGGASHATFTALAEAAGVPLQINPIARNRIAEGIAASDGGIESNGNEYSFTYQTSLPHLNVNERENVNERGFNLRNPGPYNFRQAANAAAEQVIGTIVGPDPRLFIRITPRNARINL